MFEELTLPTYTEQLEARISLLEQDVSFKEARVSLLEQQVLEQHRDLYEARRQRDENYKRWWALVEKFDPESNTLEDMIEEIFQLSPELKPEIKYTISKELRV